MSKTSQPTRYQAASDDASDGLDTVYAVVRTETRAPAAWDHMAQRVADQLRGRLPSATSVLRSVPIAARHGHESSQILHAEPDGSFSVVALISRPGQATSIHDHTTWCVSAVIEGVEHEERFALDESGQSLTATGVRTDHQGAISGFSPPGDIHRVTNTGSTVSVSLHIYGTDISRIGSSVRRIYDLPVR